jgi:hypothetical protein
MRPNKFNPFIRGTSCDLPIFVSRESLQHRIESYLLRMLTGNCCLRQGAYKDVRPVLALFPLELRGFHSSRLPFIEMTAFVGIRLINLKPCVL